jgi:hypothetical protein
MFQVDSNDEPITKICYLYDNRPKIRPSKDFVTIMGWTKIFAGQLVKN